MSFEAHTPQMPCKLPNIPWTLPFRSRLGLWLGGAVALVTLTFLDPNLRTGMQGIVVVATIAATKELIWDFVIRGNENSTIDTDTAHATSGFAVIYLLGLIAFGA